MSATVLVIGTDHGFQRRDSMFTEAQHASFRDLLFRTIVVNDIVSLAEENNQEALAENQITESTVKEIARVCGIPHRHCDPDRTERSTLGIKQENDIRIQAFFEGLSERAIQDQINESMRTRERFWLDSLIEWDRWPVLFVCGANHSLPFFELLKEGNVEVVLVAEDWST